MFLPVFKGCGSSRLDFNAAFITKQGGISNGETIYMRIGFKPTSTIGVSSMSSSCSDHEFNLIILHRYEVHSIYTKVIIM